MLSQSSNGQLCFCVMSCMYHGILEPVSGVKLLKTDSSVNELL